MAKSKLYLFPLGDRWAITSDLSEEPTITKWLDLSTPHHWEVVKLDQPVVIGDVIFERAFTTKGSYESNEEITTIN